MNQTGRTYRVVCSGCQKPLMVFYKVGGRLTVDMSRPAIRIADGSTAHQQTDGRVDVGDELHDCTDSVATLECKCSTRDMGLRAFAEQAEAALSAPGKRTISQMV